MDGGATIVRHCLDTRMLENWKYLDNDFGTSTVGSTHFHAFHNLEIGLQGLAGRPRSA